MAESDAIRRAKIEIEWHPSPIGDDWVRGFIEGTLDRVEQRLIEAGVVDPCISLAIGKDDTSDGDQPCLR